MKVSVPLLAPQQKQSKKMKPKGLHLPQEWRNQLHQLSSGDHLLVEDDQAAQEVLVGLGAAQSLAHLRDSDRRGTGALRLRTGRGRPRTPGSDTVLPTQAHESLRELHRQTGSDRSHPHVGIPAMSALGHYSNKGPANDELNPSENPVTAGLQNTGIVDNTSCNCSTTNPPRLLLNSREYLK